jgi:ATP-dependent RNA helicase SUPV3L1/SUV3
MKKSAARSEWNRRILLASSSNQRFMWRVMRNFTHQQGSTSSRHSFQDDKSQVKAVLGPTNTGKTHYAIERMLGHESGIIGLPLRLLAREVYDKVKAKKGAGVVALITGEEKILPPHAKYFICTVEAMPQDRPVSFLAVDEIQLAADPDRGHIFTNRLLHARGQDETLFLGAETMRQKLKGLIGNISFTTRPRFSHLSYMGPKKVSRLPRRTAIVGFSTDNVYSIAELIRQQRGGAAVVLGALSPRTRNAQVELYQSGEVDFLVATDAIGMGLNMDVDHVAFSDIRKFDGRGYRDLQASELAQIAGRAGRYMNDGTFGTTAECPQISQDLIEQIEEHDFEPIRALQWRNSRLDYSSLVNLIRSLEMKAPQRGLMRAREADDLVALRALVANSEMTKLVLGPEGVRKLWEVCQIPDFRKVMADEHANLLSNVFSRLMVGDGHLDEDWVAGHVNRLDRTDGDLDTLSNRIAHTRTWTFISNRSGWLRDPAHWQDRTRAVEDTLSDALHERLTQRFIDRRTNHLIRRLKSDEALMAAINKDGEVTVEGEYVGRINGFRFLTDTRIQTGGALEAKALRTAATKAIEPEIVSRASRFVASPDEAIDLRSDGTVWWQGGQVARLAPGEAAMRPVLELIVDTLMPSAYREQVQGRLQTWFSAHLEKELAPLKVLDTAVNAPVKEGSTTQLSGLARGVGYQLLEELGFLNRANVVDDIKSLDQAARAQLRKLGVRFGEFSIFMPALLKPAPAKTLVILRAVADTRQKDGVHHQPMPAGLTSLEGDKAVPNATYNAAGFRRCGHRIVRLDMLERLATLIRDQKTQQIQERKAAGKLPIVCFTFPSFKAPKAVKAPRGAFEITPDMMSLVGCSGDDFAEILRSLGYRKITLKSGGEDHVFWRFQIDGDQRRGTQSKGSRPKTSGRNLDPKNKKSKGHKSEGPNQKRSASDPKRDQKKNVQRQQAPKKERDLSDSPFAALQALRDKT